MAILGGILGMFFSTTPVGIYNFEYYRFFIAHIFIIIAYVYYAHIYDSFLDYEGSLDVMKFIFVLANIMLVFNIIFDTHFFYLGPEDYNQIGVIQIVSN